MLDAVDHEGVERLAHRIDRLSASGAQVHNFAIIGS